MAAFSGFITGTCSVNNGSKNVTITVLDPTSRDPTEIASGTAIFIDNFPPVEAVSGSGLALEITLAENWPHATVTAQPFTTIYTIEGLRDAVQRARRSADTYVAFATSFETLLTSTDPTVTIGTPPNDVTVTPYGYLSEQFNLFYGFTVVSLVSNTQVFSADTVLNINGYSVGGDGGQSQWVQNGVTGQTASQTPEQLNDALLNDANGNQWRLMGDIKLAALADISTSLTNAYNVAVGALNAGRKDDVILPSGEHLIDPNSTDLISNVEANIRGAGRGVTTLITSADGGKLIEYDRISTSTLTLNDFSIICGAGFTTSTAIEVTFTGLTGISGGVDMLVMNNVEVEAEQTGWWRRHVVAIETGGLVFNHVYFRNGGQTAAQNDVNTASIEIVNTNLNIDIIRAINANQLMMQRANTLLLMQAERSIESVYLNDGELIGCDYGIRTIGAGKIGAWYINVHMDCIKRCIVSDTDFNFAQINGDLRLSNNGATEDINGINIEINGNSEMLQATGILSATTLNTNAKAIEVNGNLINSTINSHIRTDATGIDMTNAQTVSAVSMAPTFSDGVVNKYISIPEQVFIKDQQLENGTFDGNVDDLMTNAALETNKTMIHRLGGSATGLPAGVIPGGSVIQTMAWNSDAAHQVLYPIQSNLEYSYVRTKQSGVIGDWGRQGAPLDTTVSNPSLITVENGIVTDIVDSFDINTALIKNPIAHVLKKNKLVDTLDGSLTFTRASTATYINKYGKVASASIDEPREESAGWLFEQSSTNLLTDSQALHQPAWSKYRCSVTTNSTESPDGTTTADIVIEDTQTSSRGVRQINVAIGNGGNYSLSCFFKAYNVGADRNMRLYLDNLGGSDYTSIIDSSNGNVLSEPFSGATKVTKLSNGWFRASLEVNNLTVVDNNLGQANFGLTEGLNTSYTGDGVSGLYIWGCQFEEVGAATSYIPTTGSTVTRSHDIASFDILNNFVGGDFPFTIALKTTRLSNKYSNGNLDTLLSVQGGFEPRFRSSNGDIIATYGSATVDSTAVLEGENSFVFTYDGSSIYIYLNGIKSAEVAVVTPFTLDETLKVAIGNNYDFTSRAWNGHIYDVKFYDTNLTDAEVLLL